MDDRYTRTMEQAERVLQTMAGQAERALQNLAARTPEARAAKLRERQRRNREAGRRAKRVFIALAAVVFAAIAWGLFVGPIGVVGVMLAVMLGMCLAVFLSTYPSTRRQVSAVEALSNVEVVHRLDSLLIRERPSLPAPALAQVDAISAQLPLLEKKLETLDALDPLAQDARRLMGQHLPDLIERYEKVPASYRKQRDAEGISIEDRLLSGLGAAKSAIDDIGAKLAQGDVSAFETQGRFIESRYKDSELS